MSANIDMIIAHYKEDIDWINSILKLDIRKIYLYSKYSEYKYSIFTEPSKVILKKLPNIGREAHTYLYHIISNYDNLADYNIFLQGSPSLRKPLDRKINSLFCQPFIKNNVSHSYNFTKRAWPCLDKKNKLLRWRGENLLDTGKNFYEWFAEYVDKDHPKLPYKIYFEANFAIRKDKILSRSIDYYKRLLDQLTENNTEAAHFFERCWYYIFNLHR